ncbi:MAG: DNA primase [Planctomycetota bacterium]
MQDEEFRRALEAIKLRAPIEDVVRERVPGLKKSGNGWVACCPFHEERTPSFRVDPRRGTWHCFGACGTGGDQISFLQRIDNLPFMEAFEILAARTGVEMPRRPRRGELGGGSPGQEAGEEDAVRAVLERAKLFFRRELDTPEGARAAAYLRGRGLSSATAESFEIGYAPANGQALVSTLRDAGIDLAHAMAAGLVRRTDEGRAYDFFRGRLVIPIRDERGRTVGFGARRLRDDEASGPKYVNTEETALFRKGRLVYALDRALPRIRKEGRIVLVEGYTDVMAAHQHGFENVVAVLGTSTTEDHAALIRRSGARRATLVFDGDEAGSKAAGRALHGLLPLEIEIDVVALNGGVDPCDLLIQDGAEGFRAHLDLARGWFEHTCQGLDSLSGVALSREVDRVLELLARVKTPVHRESLLKALAARLDLPAASLREQWRMRGGGRPAESHRPTPASPVVQPDAARDPRERRAWGEIAGALVADASLIPLARARTERCPEADLRRIFAAILDLYGREDATIDAGSVMNLLAEDPSRDLVVPLVEKTATAESPREQLEGALRRLAACEREAEGARLKREVALQENLRLAGSSRPD